MLDAARHLLDSRAFRDIAVREIPDQLGLAKGTIYRYFGSKEEVFLSVLDQELTDFGDSVIAGLEPLAASNDFEAVCTVLSENAVARPRLCELMSVLPTILEHNASEDAVRGLKLTLESVVGGMSEALAAALPCLDETRMPSLVMSFYSLATGLWSSAHPSAAVAEVLDDPAFANLRIDFDQHLYASVLALFKGSC